MRFRHFLLLLMIAPSFGRAEDNWQTVLSRMPLQPAITQLNRTNCVAVMLGSFESNAVVKALIFMPGATDEFYMFHRGEARLASAFPTLLDALVALTNQTRIRATFQAPFLLLHTEVDPLETQITVRHQPAFDKLARTKFLPCVFFNDQPWDSIQPLLKKTIGGDVRPWRDSGDAYHFYRVAFKGWNLTSLEMIEATALASRTSITIGSQSFLGLRASLIRFECDLRPGKMPKIEH